MGSGLLGRASARDHTRPLALPRVAPVVDFPAHAGAAVMAGP